MLSLCLETRKAIALHKASQYVCMTLGDIDKNHDVYLCLDFRVNLLQPDQLSVDQPRDSSSQSSTCPISVQKIYRLIDLWFTD